MRMIDTDRLPVKSWKKTAAMFQDDYTAGAGTDWALKVAMAENRMLWEIISAIENAPTLTQPNEQLTLEELSLFNAPVWIKRIGDEDLSGDGWAIVEGPRCLTWRNRIPVSWEIRVWWPGSEVEDYPNYENYGETWLAYRRPPEGEE